MNATGVTAIAFAALVFMVHSLDMQIASSLSSDAVEPKKRPVSKVVALLKDMLKTLEKEAEADEQIYDNLACWCETNDKEKSKSIADSEASISKLTTEVEDLTAQSAGLTTEIANLEQEVAANKASLDKATMIRRKQLAEFTEEEKELTESITALKAAVIVLSKHHSSLLQMPKTHVMGIAASIQHELQKHASLLTGVLTHDERKALSSFVQSPESLLQYAPRSGQIFGILSQMKETFETNLAAAQKEEAESQKAYEELKEAKETEIAAGQAQIDKKTGQRAEADEKNAQSKEDISDTEDSLSADEEFLTMLKDKCSLTDEEWKTRQKTRALEMEAVSKALAVLNADDAFDVFTRTFNPSFIQKASTVASDRRAAASKILSVVSNKFNNPRLATLAVSVKLDAFTRVKKAIDDMVAELMKQKEEEIRHKDFCVDELNKNALKTQKKEFAKADVKTKIETLKMEIETLTKEIATLKDEIAEMKLQLKHAGEDRAKENAEFQVTIADQRETQKLLAAALDYLKGFYTPGEAAALLQKKQEPAGPPPPPGFATYEKNAASGEVIKMIEKIIYDAKTMETDTIRDEMDAQKAYEEFVVQTNKSIEAKTKEMVHKSETKAQAEKDLIAAEQALEDVNIELDQLANMASELHVACDYILKNFDIRQAARDEEVEALKQAKAILSGADFGEFLQRA